MLKTYSCSKGPGLCIVMSCDSESNVTSLTICVCACVYHIGIVWSEEILLLTLLFYCRK